jgi:inosine/xanthosine triphosphatase
MEGDGPPGSSVLLSLRSVDVESGVPEQPIGFEQIRAGARNRARAALASGACALAVGIEDGLVTIDPPQSEENASGLESGSAREAGDRSDRTGAYNVGCAWVTDGDREGHGLSSGFLYPPGCLIPALRDQEPIGALFDALWRRERDAQATAESGRGEGNIGRLTGGRLTRSDYGAQAVLCALVPFLHVDLYD